MASSALIFGILINVAILLVFFRFLIQLTGVTPIILWFYLLLKPPKL